VILNQASRNDSLTEKIIFFDKMFLYSNGLELVFFILFVDSCIFFNCIYESEIVETLCAASACSFVVDEFEIVVGALSRHEVAFTSGPFLGRRVEQVSGQLQSVVNQAGNYALKGGAAHL
jgi:hypothetical protein